MKTTSKIALLTLGAVSAAAFAGSASATNTEFARFLPKANAADVSWVRTATKGTITNTASNATWFTFDLNPTLSGLGFLSSTLTLSATSTALIPLGQLDQPGIGGSFKFTYTGLAPITYKGVTIHTGANLLSGTFSGADITTGVGSGGGVGSFLNDNATAVFASDLLTLTGPNEGFSWDLGSVSPHLVFISGKRLNSFKAVSGGSFFEDIAGGGGGGTPEPTSWALMVAGFGLAGGALRAKKKTAAI